MNMQKKIKFNTNMRPRINGFGRISYTELAKYFDGNSVYGFTATKTDTTITYTYFIMFRKTTKDPEILFIEVSRVSKLVLKAWTNMGKKFNNVDELKRYTKFYI